jgi:hypothetical protein
MKQLVLGLFTAALLFGGRVGCRAYGYAMSKSDRAVPTGPATPVASRTESFLRFVDPRTGELYEHVPAFEAERARREFGLVPVSEWESNPAEKPVDLLLERW